MSSLCLLILDYITLAFTFAFSFPQCIILLKTVTGNIAGEPVTEYVRSVICFWVVLSAVVHMRKFIWSSELPEYVRWFSCILLVSSPLNVGPENRFIYSKIGAQATICICSWCEIILPPAVFNKHLQIINAIWSCSICNSSLWYHFYRGITFQWWEGAFKELGNRDFWN